MGNVHLKWAFSEAAVLFVRHSAEGKKLLARLERALRQGQGALHPRPQAGDAPPTSCWRARRPRCPGASPPRKARRCGASEPVAQREPKIELEETATHPGAASCEQASIVSPRSGSPSA